MKINKPHKKESPIKQYLKEKASKSIGDEGDCFVISFKHFDKTQGDSLYDWEAGGKLAHAIDVLSGYCNRSLRSQFSKKFLSYGSYPPAGKAGFRRPEYVPEDAEWARIHVNGTQIIAGHIIRNTFYVVFLDPDHSFYKTDIQDR